MQCIIQSYKTRKVIIKYNLPSSIELEYLVIENNFKKKCCFDSNLVAVKIS